MMRKKIKAAKCCNTKTAYEINSQIQYTPVWFARQWGKVAIKWVLQGKLPFETMLDLFKLNPQWDFCSIITAKNCGGVKWTI